MAGKSVSRPSYRNRERSLGSLTQQIVEDLGVAIVTGKYSDDRPFPIESEICEQYGASRSIVREAIKVLNAKGLLIARPRRGTSVRPRSEWNLLDPDVLYWMLNRRFSLPLLKHFTRARLAIEPAAAAEAARTATGKQIRDIELRLEHMAEAARGEYDPLDADVGFHASVLAASNNPFFRNMSPMIETAMRFSIRYTNKDLQLALASVEEHGRVLEAIKARDPECAADMMRHMLDKALGIMEKKT